MRIVAWVLPLVMVLAPAAQAGLCKCGDSEPVEAAPKSCCGGDSVPAAPSGCECACGCGSHDDETDSARSGCGCGHVQPQATPDAPDSALVVESPAAPIAETPACHRASIVRAFRTPGQAPPGFFAPLLI